MANPAALLKGLEGSERGVWWHSVVIWWRGWVSLVTWVAEVLELHQQPVVWLEPVVAIYLPSQGAIPVVCLGQGGWWVVGLRTHWPVRWDMTTCLFLSLMLKQHLSLDEMYPCMAGLSTVGLVWSYCTTWENCFSPYRRIVVTVGLLQCDPITSLFLEEPFIWPKCAPVRLGKGQKGMVEPWPHVVGLPLLNPNGHLPNLPYWSPQPRWIYKKNFLLKISAHGFRALQRVLLALRCPWGWCPRFPPRIWKLQVRTELMLWTFWEIWM